MFCLEQLIAFVKPEPEHGCHCGGRRLKPSLLLRTGTGGSWSPASKWRPACNLTGRSTAADRRCQPLSGGSPPARLPSREVARATATRPTPGQSTVTGDSLAGKCLSLQYSGMQYKMLKSKLEREHQIPPDTIALYRPASEVTRRARGFCTTQTQLSPFQIF